MDIDIVTAFDTKLEEAYALIVKKDYEGAYKILSSLNEIIDRKKDVQAMLKFVESAPDSIKVEDEPITDRLRRLNSKASRRRIGIFKRLSDWANQSNNQPNDPEENQEEGEK